MDRQGLIEFRAVPQSLQIPPQEYYQSANDYFHGGFSETAVAADTTYDRNPAFAAGAELTKDARRKKVRVYMFFDNGLTDDAVRLLVDAKIPSDSTAYKTRQTEIKNMQRGIQNEWLGCGAETNASAGNSRWLPNFIITTIENHNFRAYFHNIRIQLLHTQIEDASLGSVKRQQRQDTVNALTMTFNDRKHEYLRMIDKFIAHAKTQRRDSEVNKNFSHPRYIAFCETWRAEILAQDLYEPRSMRYYIPPFKPYYDEMPGDMKEEFWSRHWNKDTCISFYHHFADLLDIEKMRLEDKGIAIHIERSWICACISSFDYILYARLLDGEPASRIPNARESLAEFPTQPRNVYEAMRNVKLPPGKEKSFDDVWVASAARGMKRKRNYKAPVARHKFSFALCAGGPNDDSD